MDENESRTVGDRVLEAWEPDQVWFRDYLSDGAPWCDEELLADAPDADEGLFKLDRESTARTREEFRNILDREEAPQTLLVPWYRKVIPAGLILPHEATVDLTRYRRDIARRWIRALLLTACFVGVALYVPLEYRILTLIGATIYGLFPLVEFSMAWLRRVDRYSVDELNRRTVNGELFRRWITTRPTRLMKVAVGVLAAVFLGQKYVTGGLFLPVYSSIESAALMKPAVLERGEWWRLVTTGLMHGGGIHILFNGMALYSLGRVIVALVSPWLLSSVFFVTVVTGSLASLYLGGDRPSVGASGGILGCLGFLLVVTIRFRRELPAYLRSSLIQSTIVVAIFGFLGSQFIDNAAHAGGFFGGVALAALLYPKLQLAPTETPLPVRLSGLISLAVLTLGLAKIAYELSKI